MKHFSHLRAERQHRFEEARVHGLELVVVRVRHEHDVHNGGETGGQLGAIRVY